MNLSSIIRESLATDFNQPVADIVKHAKRKGFANCTPQHVYQIKTTLRKNQGQTVGVTTTAGPTELESLRNAVINFARVKGIENPEQFPQRLIDTLEQYQRAEQAISLLTK